MENVGSHECLTLPVQNIKEIESRMIELKDGLDNTWLKELLEKDGGRELMAHYQSERISSHSKSIKVTGEDWQAIKEYNLHYNYLQARRTYTEGVACSTQEEKV